ncbi:YadA C-terminal domain-containing protein [Enterobacter cloacae]|uniref:YadA C-terminal domain-containing protein n=1 Tax=Enterobacter cloacae TaxID=550 RepID=UPI0013EFB652|nr:YadA C-terminal domain-containing protein [Enterobacter cloacae]
MKLNKIAAIVLATMATSAASPAFAYDQNRMNTFNMVFDLYVKANDVDKIGKFAELHQKWQELDADGQAYVRDQGFYTEPSKSQVIETLFYFPAPVPSDASKTPGGTSVQPNMLPNGYSPDVQATADILQSDRDALAKANQSKADVKATPLMIQEPTAVERQAAIDLQAIKDAKKGVALAAQQQEKAEQMISALDTAKASALDAESEAKYQTRKAANAQAAADRNAQRGAVYAADYQADRQNLLTDKADHKTNVVNEIQSAQVDRAAAAKGVALAAQQQEKAEQMISALDTAKASALDAESEAKYQTRKAANALAAADRNAQRGAVYAADYQADRQNLLTDKADHKTNVVNEIQSAQVDRAAAAKGVALAAQQQEKAEQMISALDTAKASTLDADSEAKYQTRKTFAAAKKAADAQLAHPDVSTLGASKLNTTAHKVARGHEGVEVSLMHDSFDKRNNVLDVADANAKQIAAAKDAADAQLANPAVSTLGASKLNTTAHKVARGHEGVEVDLTHDSFDKRNNVLDVADANAKQIAAAKDAADAQLASPDISTLGASKLDTTAHKVARGHEGVEVSLMHDSFDKRNNVMDVADATARHIEAVKDAAEAQANKTPMRTPVETQLVVATNVPQPTQFTPMIKAKPETSSTTIANEVVTVDSHVTTDELKAGAHDGDRLANMNAAASTAQAKVYADQKAAEVEATALSGAKQNAAQIHNLDSFTTALNGTVQKQAIENIVRDDAINKNANAITDVKTIVSANTRGMVAASDVAHKAQTTADTALTQAAVNKTAIETVKASAHDGDRLAKMNAAASNAQAKVYADQKAGEVVATEQPQISKMAATEQHHYNTLAATEDKHFTELQYGVKHAENTGAYAQKRAADAQAYAEANRQALIDTNTRVAQNTADIQAQGQQQAAFEAQTNQKFSNIDKKIDKVEKKAMRGIAGANALAGLPQLNQDDTFGVAAALGGYEGESAIAVGASAHPFENKAVTVKAGVTATNGAMGWNAGVGYSFK